MNKKDRTIVISVLTTATIILLCACPLDFAKITNKNASEKLIVASWNVQNIFDGTDNGTEYDEYKTQNGWNEQLYQKRLQNAETVFEYGKLGEADVIVLNEVENREVVEDILNLKSMKKRGFLYCTCAGEKNGAIQTAVISRIPITDVKVHNLDGLRPVLQIELQSKYEKLFILAIHAKSNLDGVEETAPQRLTTSEMINRIADEINGTQQKSIIMIAGDFNESFYDKNMMTDMRNAGNTADKNSIPVLPDFRYGTWYCFWMDNSQNLNSPGSYYYGQSWKSYDNILISHQANDSEGWEFNCAGVVFQGILQTTDMKPNSYKRNLLSGVSDHLPVWVELVSVRPESL